MVLAYLLVRGLKDVVTGVQHLLHTMSSAGVPDASDRIFLHHCVAETASIRTPPSPCGTHGGEQPPPCGAEVAEAFGRWDEEAVHCPGGLGSDLPEQPGRHEQDDQDQPEYTCQGSGQIPEG
jgi:hypothetical protein